MNGLKIYNKIKLPTCSKWFIKMAELKTVVKLNDKDLKALICEKYNLDPAKATIRVRKLEGNQREPEYTEVTVESTLI